MPTDHLTEVLAMNIWLGIFGEKILRADWIEWAAANKVEADGLRAQAETMLGVAQSHAKQGANARPRTSHHHSLGWLFS